ncbi:hypothetical protein DIE19_27770 [Burkholderia sp. Bp9126]|nr:hypothetical protein DIE19_27770 [Burkholderia sp. Bp9126]
MADAARTPEPGRFLSIAEPAIAGTPMPGFAQNARRTTHRAGFLFLALALISAMLNRTRQRTLDASGAFGP